MEINRINRLISRNENNFNLIRLIAAFFVIITHSYALLGLPENDTLNRLTHGLVSFSQLGVYTFFVVSGTLIYASLERSTDLGSFFAKRARRIFPALITVIFLSVFILGPLLTNLSAGAYFSTIDTYSYLGGILLYKLQYTLPGVFAYNPYPNALNGSLWTLPYEWTCYLLIALIRLIPKPSRAAMLSMAVLAALGVRIIVGHFRIAQVIPLLHLDMRQLMLFSALFFLGALYYELRNRLPINGFIAVSLSMLLILTSQHSASLYFLLVTLPYVIFYGATIRLPERVTKLSTTVDISYGLYIYAFPAAQLWLNFYGRALTVPLLILATTVTTIPLALASWYFVEKPFLRIQPADAALKKPVTNLPDMVQ